VLKFEWDENKNKSNIKKHDIDFNDAKEVFDDPKSIETEDTRKDYGESRFIIIGKVKNVILTVVYTIRVNAIRLISARRSRKDERNSYNSQQNNVSNGS
jgi:uncharacterized DUF497 family protein